MVKRIAFNQNLYVDRDNYETRVNQNPTLEQCRSRPHFNKELACIKAFITTVAMDNGHSIEEFCHEVFNVMNMTNHKKRTLLLYGDSDSGKSLLGNLLTSVYSEYEIGNVSCPTSNQQSDFWLQDCIGKEVYRMEEMVIEYQAILQRIKQLMEGNRGLDTNVKYGDNKKILPKPVLITMNAKYEYDIVGRFQDELEPFLNRCFHLNMRKPLKDYIPKELFVIFGNAGVVLNAFIYHYHLKFLSIRDVNIETEIESFVDQWVNN